MKVPGDRVYGKDIPVKEWHEQSFRGQKTESMWFSLWFSQITRGFVLVKEE